MSRKQAGKVYSLIHKDHVPDITQSTNGFIHLACKSCGEKVGRSGVYSPRSRMYRCFQGGCEYHSWTSVYKYISYYRNINIEAVRALIDRQDIIDLDDSFYESPVKTFAKAIDLPEGCIPINYGDTKLFHKMKSYMNNRGFDLEWLYEKYRMYYVKEAYTEGFPNRYFGRIIVPFYDIYGDLVYFQARDYLETQALRWDNPPSSVLKHGKEQVMFNIRSLYVDNPQIGTIHEGVFDAVEMEKPVLNDIRACSLGGVTVSPYQLYLLAYAPVKQYYIVLDSGTWENALELALSLSTMTDKPIYLVDLEGGDPNDLGKERVLECFKDAFLFSFSFYIDQKYSLIRDGAKTYRNKESKKFKIFNF